jgi:high affinity Mn2+ porin
MRIRSLLQAAAEGRFLLSIATLFLACGVHADPLPLAENLGEGQVSPPASSTWSAFGQVTNVTQWHGSFRSPYSGPNSLSSDGPAEETSDATIYAGARLWRGAELWANPEVDQGYGLSGTLGVAGFPSGEAYKIGADAPYLRLPRMFIRQYIPLGGAIEHVEALANQFAYESAADSLTVTAGKFSVVDIFDANRYAHDPRGDFLNWSLIDAGTFDYAADSWGFTYGAATELAVGRWTLRGGVFQLSPVPNGKIIRVDFSQYSVVTELEARYDWGDRPGKAKVLGFVNRGKMGTYSDAVQLASQSGGTPDTASVRRFSSRPGVSVDLEQEVSSELGVFARAGANDGRYEAYEFTEINKTVSAGLSLAGERWGRPDDKVGIGAVVNALSGEARSYFSAGGLGILIGDGRMNYGREQILEAYYSLKVNARVALSIDYQHVENPAYNRDRGPVSVFGVRLHAEL